GVEVYSTAFVIEEAPQTAGELWVGSDDGRIHITRDGGNTWAEITPKGLIPFECTINKIELSVHAPGRAFFAVQNYRNNDFKPYILRTNDYGKTWQLLTDGKNGIPSGHFTRAIAEDSNKKGLLFVGTEYGMYVSFDDGAHWQSLQLNLPHTPITDLESHQGDLAMSTQGRGFWLLEDVNVLEQVQNEQAKAKLHLFKPRDTYRTNVSGYRAVFHAYLAEAPAKDAESKVEILNASGKVVRTYSSNGEDRRSKIGLKKGWNILSWDLSHDGPINAEKLVLMEMGVPIMGPPAAPGDYQVRITMGKESKTQSFKVLADPRWKDVKLEDYMAQEKLALEMRDLISDSQRKVKNLRSLRQQIEDAAGLAVKAGHPTRIKDLATELAKGLTAVEDEIVQNQAEAGQDNFNYPRRFINRIARIYGVLIWDHHRPTGGVIEAYADMQKVYDGIKARYDVAVKNTLEQFNKVLEEEKVARVIDLK
ncbi:MAG TPA: glycosyl hydrolase, partial [Haliscomenobacter sp.]|nr:glycosyl hydrolase [Haliscomenobacter sp.]